MPFERYEDSCGSGMCLCEFQRCACNGLLDPWHKQAGTRRFGRRCCHPRSGTMRLRASAVAALLLALAVRAANTTADELPVQGGVACLFVYHQVPCLKISGSALLSLPITVQHSTWSVATSAYFMACSCRRSRQNTRSPASAISWLSC